MRLRTIYEAITSVDFGKCPENCEQCGKPGDLRPYGKDGAWICFKCGMKDEEETTKNFGKILNGAQVDGVITEAKSTSTACVDFDGTVHSYTSGFNKDKFDAPVEGAIDALIELSKRYGSVYIYTSRKSLDPVKTWLKEQFEIAGLKQPRNIKFTNIKVPADVYIDDRGYKFEGDWPKALKELDTYKTWMNESLSHLFLRQRLF